MTSIPFMPPDTRPVPPEELEVKWALQAADLVRLSAYSYLGQIDKERQQIALAAQQFGLSGYSLAGALEAAHQQESTAKQVVDEADGYVLTLKNWALNAPPNQAAPSSPFPIMPDELLAFAKAQGLPGF